MTPELICEVLGLDINKIFNIYPYGSKIYGTDDEYSDSDYVLVFKSALLDSGAFKDNAISSDDRLVQGTCYSRGGFIDAINNYQITALECIFLPEDKIIQKKFPFRMNKFNKKELSKKIITTASASWHNATTSEDFAKKNVFHALRILDFGIQIKEHQTIVNYSSMNDLADIIHNDNNFKTKHFLEMFLELSKKMKS